MTAPSADEAEVIDAGGSRRSPAVILDGVSKIYGHAGSATPALDRIWLEVGQGEWVCLVGASGCGKSTMLHLIAGLDEPSAGTLEAQEARPHWCSRTPLCFPG